MLAHASGIPTASFSRARPRHPRRAFAVVAAAVLLGSLALNGPAVASPLVPAGPLELSKPPAAAPPSGSDQRKEFATTTLKDPRLTRQVPLTSAGDRIQRLVSAEGLHGFAGTAIQNGGLVLRWKGQVPSSMRDLVGKLRANVRVDVRPARYSLAQLDREARRIANASTANPNLRITAVGPRSDSGGLRVAVERASAITHARVGIQPRVDTTFTVMPALKPTIGRWDDTEPFWGGAAIINTDGSFACSTGFAVNRSSGGEGMITARHCGPNTDWWVPSGERFVGSTDSGDVSTDAAVLEGATYGPGIYVGPWDSFDGRGIVAAFNPIDESFVFGSGAFSGAHSLRVKEVNQFVSIDGVMTGPGFFTVDDGQKGSVGEGDSGGPVANAATDPTYLVARGMIEAIDGTTQAPCLGLGDRVCGWRAFHINIGSIESELGLSVQKTATG